MGPDDELLVALGDGRIYLDLFDLVIDGQRVGEGVVLGPAAGAPSPPK